jgi:O-antigen ligase
LTCAATLAVFAGAFSAISSYFGLQGVFLALLVGSLPIFFFIFGKPDWALSLLLISGFYALPIALGPIRFAPSDVLIQLVMIVWIFMVLISKNKIHVPVLVFPILLLFINSVLSFVYAEDIFRVMLGSIQIITALAVPYFLISNLVSTEKQVKLLLKAFIIGAIFSSIYNIYLATILSKSGISNFPQVWGIGGGFQGYFLSVAFILLYSFFIQRIRLVSRFNLTLYFVIFSILVAAIVLTQTRGAWLSLSVCMFIITILASRKKLAKAIGYITAVILMFIIIEPFLPVVIEERIKSIFIFDQQYSGSESTMVRIQLTKAALAMFLEHPLIGIGIKNFPVLLPNYVPTDFPLSLPMGLEGVITPIEGPHNCYLRLLAEQGVFGLIIFSYILLLSLNRAYTAFRCASDATRRAISLGVTGSVIIIICFNMFGEMIASGGLLFVTMIILSDVISRKAT